MSDATKVRSQLIAIYENQIEIANKNLNDCATSPASVQQLRVLALVKDNTLPLERHKTPAGDHIVRIGSAASAARFLVKEAYRIQKQWNNTDDAKAGDLYVTCLTVREYYEKARAQAEEIIASLSAGITE